MASKLRNSIRSAALLALVSGHAAGCTQLIVLAEDDEGGTVPADVQAVFNASCQLSGGCHADSAAGLSLSESGSYIGQQSNVGTLLVDPEGNLENSEVAVRIEDGTMPPAGFELTEAGRFTVLGWIAAGAPLEGGDGGTGGTGGGQPGDEQAGETMADTLGADTGDTGEESSGTGGGSGNSGEFVEFAPVLTVIQENCGGVGCHREGGVTSPIMEDENAYDNIVGVPSNAGPNLIEPGDSANSQIVVRVSATDATVMPPSYAVDPAPLTPDEVATITAWIDAGAAL